MKRSQIRENIFKLLFRLDFHNSEDMKEQLNFYLDDIGLVQDYPEIKDDISKMTLEEKELVINTVKNIIDNIPEIDNKINEVSDNWKTSRMTKVDLTIIRLAVYEIQMDENVPDKVAINEAVELAKMYGTDKSKAFVNGVLSRFVD
ncbi:transcription antitermination factor NusB [Lachnobacterium bovis]|uniref:Transcription antitermination protein NusB n=1 Tax=Lachnobacterium bovis TaxID=140626 RepID=A0A1H9PTH3_9FIRM|nr:transcription antitermination factor NusB [Lachnobacterium bovis]SER51596.1 NusB antitermination factor [Lachnobacterium bovis]